MGNWSENYQSHGKPLKEHSNRYLLIRYEDLISKDKEEDFY